VIVQPYGIAWIRLHLSKIHAARIGNGPRQSNEATTLCGRDIADNAYLDDQPIDENAICSKCKSSLYAWGYLNHEKEYILKNRKLTVSGVYLSDVAKALKEQDILLTEQNIEAAAIHVEQIASAYAKAALQDMSQEDWLEWIEVFTEGNNHGKH
jgi:hypothetical protein